METNKQRHILHVTHNMDFGGTEQVIRQIVSGVDPDRFVSSIVCIDGRVGEIGNQMIAAGVSVHSIRRGSGFDTTAIASLRALIKETGADVLHCHQYTPFCYSAFASILLKVEFIYTEHGRFYPDRFTWKRRLVNQLLYRLTDHIICISQATRQALDTYEWIPQRRVGVIYNGVRKPSVLSESGVVRSTLGISPETLILGTISRFDSIKNQAMMIEALATFSKTHSDVALIMAGDGSERSQLEARAESLGVSDIVHFTGFITNIGDYLDTIDIFLLTSFSEGTSMTLLEAMAMGKVIVATAVGGNVEVIDHERTGLLIESNDTRALVDRLAELSGDQEKRQRLSEAARIEYAKRFSVQKMSMAYQVLYLTA